MLKLSINAVNNNESFASAIYELEKVTGANSFASASQTKFNKLLELDEKYTFEDYKNLAIDFSTSDNKSFKVIRSSKVQDSIKTIPWTVESMDNYGREKVNQINQLLKLGHAVKIRMRIHSDNDISEWEEKIAEFKKIKAAINGIGTIQEEPTLERNGKAVYMIITSR